MGNGLISVRMFGEFSILYNDKPITLERNSVTKATQLLQYLIFHADTMITRDKLISVIYGDDDLLNPQNNLKVSIFRLRKLLQASILPEGDYIFQQSGMYYWHSETPVEIDVKVFAETAHEAADFRRDPAERLKLLKKAIELYTGDFLPMIAAESWVTIESVKYREIYVSCVHSAYEIMDAMKDYEDMLAISCHAVRVYPYDEELHIMKISALLALRRYQEALAAYDDAAKLFLEGLGVSPSTKMLELYRQITGNAHAAAAYITEVKAGLKENEPMPGAYYCNFPGFIDSYRYISRLVQRNGQSIFLMLCTLTDTQGMPLELGDKLTEAAEVLGSVIFKSLRKCDLYTRYSPCQFLILLMGISLEGCQMVSTRINRQFKEQCTVRGARLSHSATSGIDIDFPVFDIEFSEGTSFLINNSLSQNLDNADFS